MRSTAIPVLVCLLAASSCATGTVRPLPSPAGPGSLGPDLTLGADGTLYLSWMEPLDQGHALRFSTWDGDAWSPARTVTSGEGWFVNWADFPSVNAAADGTLAAHWLVRSGESKYAYDVRMALSYDGGASWSEPLTPHRDGTETEHGFVSVVPRTDGDFEVLWLDGREMAVDERGTPLGRGVTTLRATRLGRDGTLGEERLIDDRVCDCCATDALLTGEIVLAAYRDRSAGEIRDIAAVRLEEGDPSAGALLHDDSWKIAACPVNGPALAAADDSVACTWFTAPEQRGIVRVAFSADGGRTFGAPLRVDGGDPTGRVDVVLLDDGTAVVGWLERGALRLRRMGREGPLSEPVTAARTDSTRASGFPRLARLGESIHLAWTEPGEPSQVRTAVVPADLRSP